MNKTVNFCWFEVKFILISHVALDTLIMQTKFPCTSEFIRLTEVNIFNELFIFVNLKQNSPSSIYESNNLECEHAHQFSLKLEIFLPQTGKSE